MQTAFWTSDPFILFRPESIGIIVPSKNMSQNESLNAITRMTIILTIIAYLATDNMRVIITGVVTIVSVAILKYVTVLNEDTVQPFNVKEGFATLNKSTLDGLHLQKPTKTNPMMNVLLPQIHDTPDRPPAMPAYNPVVEDEINKSTQEMIVGNFDNPEGINDKLFSDLGDSFQFDRSMIQFNSNANTTVTSDQKSFAEFCYGDMISCKEGDAIACTNSMPPNWING